MILPYKLGTTNDLLTSRAGLLSIAELMESVGLAERIDQHFPLPGSNRGYQPSELVKTLILMQHEGSFHLDDIRHFRDDDALLMVLGLDKLPCATTLGDWLRRVGSQPQIQDAWVKVNRTMLQSALHHCHQVTLDIDATEIIANKADAEWTYNKNKGFMPMVGHLAETGQIVAIDFRQGNTPPAQANFEFIQQCMRALPAGCTLKALRIDAAGYQTKIIQHCDAEGIEYAIRAKTSAALRSQIEAINEGEWQPMLSRQGEVVSGEEVCRTSFCMGDYEQAFTLVIQRKAIAGQVELVLDSTDSADEMTRGTYIYRAIATNRDGLSDSEIVHWYNQRAEDSENRIKELKLDFGGDTLPCSDFNANALYLSISALSYNLFALMRQLLPEDMAQHRAITIRWRLYAIAAKIVKTGRQLFVKLKDQHRNLLDQVLTALKRLEPPPI